MSLWAEARANGIATVLMPHQEIFLKPARIFSLCRGVFDLALPFSHYSAEQLHRLRPELRVIVAGLPAINTSVKKGSRRLSTPETGRADVIFLGGTRYELAIKPTLRAAFENWPEVQIRIRTHPKLPRDSRERLYDWLTPDRLSDPNSVDLFTDLSEAKVALTVCSTAGIHAMRLGLPVVWLTLPAFRDRLRSEPIRAQGLPIIEVVDAHEIRSAISRLLNDLSESNRVKAAQEQKMLLHGLTQDYFAISVTALRQLATIQT
jgi:hypothetical protein